MLSKIKKFYIKHFKLFYFFSFVILIIYAWSNRFIQDDAFISFRYAENLANGEGLVFNPNEKVEGYTNFLWTLIASLIIYLDLPLIQTIYLIGLVIYSFSLVVLFKLSQLIFNNKYKALIPVIIAGVNFSFSSYATGGLETQLQALLFILAFYLFYLIVQTEFSNGKALLIGTVFSLALLNRLDAALMLATLGLSFIVAMYQKSIPIKKGLVFLSFITLPVIVTLSMWFYWKLEYYGDILPNTFYAKATSGGTLNTLLHGIFYVSLFFIIYALPIAFVLVAGIVRRKNIAKQAKSILSLLYPQIILVLIFLAYIIKVGGDFMEFRFFVPLIPFLAIIIYYIGVKLLSFKQQVYLFALIFISSFAHKYVFNIHWNGYGGIESISMLQNHIDGNDDNWKNIGLVLEDNFQHADAVIGVSPAGAIPYYSGLYSIDLLGLNDKWIARYGIDYKNIPGHKKIAPLDYLLERKVNIVIGHPLVVPEEHITEFRKQYARDFIVKIFPGLQNDAPPENSHILEIPLENNRRLIVWYLYPTLAIDNVIENNNWKIYRI